MEKLFGKVAYAGIVVGDVFLQNRKYQDDTKEVFVINNELEKKIFENAIHKSIKELENLKKDLHSNSELGLDLNIIDSHIMLLSDPIYIKEIEREIDKNLSAQVAIESVTQKYVKLFSELENPMYRQREIDIKDVARRLISNSQENKKDYHLLDNKILVAKEIFPTELLKIKKEKINLLGMILEYAGETSHVAILAKALKIPTLMGVKDVFNHNWNGKIILNTVSGEVLLNPNKKTILEYKQLKKEYETKIEKIETEALLPTITRDGENINIYLNIGGDTHINENHNPNIKGVGLFRTEFIYMNSKTLPDEEKQFKRYGELLKNFTNDETIVIRTLDIGADKSLPYLTMQEEKNPFLGLRGIRFTLQNKDIFKTQLRAILRISATKNIKIMYPMVTNIEEVLEANKILEIAKNELRSENKKFNQNIEVGIMVEVPSVIFMAEDFAKVVDFFSIGSNDLTQYLLATDRLSETVGYLCESLSPSVLRAIYHLTNIAKKYNKKISVCGEMAGNIYGALALMSLGVKDLSMVESSVAKIAYAIRNADEHILENIKRVILSATDREEIKDYLRKLKIF